MVEMNFQIKSITPRITEVTLDQNVSDELLSHKLQLIALLESELKTEMKELRTSYQCISILWEGESNLIKLKELLQRPSQEYALKFTTWEVPVCYALEYGKDLEFLANSKGISSQQVIDLHTNPLYRIHFFGFLPGFMYLSGLNEKLSFPRKSIPDRAIIPGSIAIGGTQTGIYPNESPGGWHVIGRTPLPLFDPKKTNPVWANPGDYIKFKSISIEEFLELEIKPSLPEPL